MQWILWFDQPKVVKFGILPGWEILSENSLCQAAEFEVYSVLHTICGEVENGLPATWNASFQLQNSKYISLCLAADFEFTTIHMLPAKSSEIRHTGWQWNLRFQSWKFQVQISRCQAEVFEVCSVLHTICGEVEKPLPGTWNSRFTMSWETFGKHLQTVNFKYFTDGQWVECFTEKIHWMHLETCLPVKHVETCVRKLKK